jgi:hypothetical protein
LFIGAGGGLNNPPHFTLLGRLELGV